MAVPSPTRPLSKLVLRRKEDHFPPYFLQDQEIQPPKWQAQKLPLLTVILPQLGSWCSLSPYLALLPTFLAASPHTLFQAKQALSQKSLRFLAPFIVPTGLLTVGCH